MAYPKATASGSTGDRQCSADRVIRGVIFPIVLWKK